MSKRYQDSKYADTRTETNLMMAFAAECQASIRYSFYASVARKCGFEQIAAIFAETAANEREHAKIWYKELALLGNTKQNLSTSIINEHDEWTNTYMTYAEEAIEEGFPELAQLFREISDIEHFHEKRFQHYFNQLMSDSIFTKAEKTFWICRNCGHIVYGKEAPEECEVCKHPQSFYEEYLGEIPMEEVR